jgi:hypothetical protein
MSSPTRPLRWGIRAIEKPELWIKRTARFGAFHGTVVLTDDVRDARIWSRYYDASRAARVATYCFSQEWMTAYRKHGRLTFVAKLLPEVNIEGP